MPHQDLLQASGPALGLSRSAPIIPVNSYSVVPEMRSQTLSSTTSSSEWFPSVDCQSLTEVPSVTVQAQQSGSLLLTLNVVYEASATAEH